MPIKTTEAIAGMYIVYRRCLRLSSSMAISMRLITSFDAACYELKAIDTIFSKILLNTIILYVECRILILLLFVNVI